MMVDGKWIAWKMAGISSSHSHFIKGSGLMCGNVPKCSDQERGGTRLEPNKNALSQRNRAFSKKCLAARTGIEPVFQE